MSAIPDRMTAAEYRRHNGIDATPSKAIAPTRANKQGSVWTEYNGRNYQSKLEAACALELDVLLKHGFIVGWIPQVPVPLSRDGKTKHLIDFLVLYPENKYEFIDAKGQDRPEGRKNRNIVRSNNGIDIRLVRKPSEVFNGALNDRA